MIAVEITPSHAFAVWLMKGIETVFRDVGITPSLTAKEVVYTIIVALVAWLIGWAVKMLVLHGSRQLAKVKKTVLMEEILQKHVLLKCSRIIPPIVMLALMPIAFRSGIPAVTIVEKVLWVYTFFVTALAINSVIELIWTRYNDLHNAKNLPIKGILNTAEGIVWVVTTICAIALIMDKSPAYLLTGLGAFAAALMLIFKDSILGLVAGIQLSQNDMLRVGDWIVVPSTPANGTVLDMSLTAVKVRNWDNTIITLPPYTLVSTTFQNYRGMQDSGVRRIARSVLIEVYSVHTLQAGEAEKIAKQLPLLERFVSGANAAQPTYNGGVAVVNGTVDTNLGLFRAYLCEYILSRPEFSHDSQVLVRLMDPTPNGLALQIYCFTSTTAWTVYEAIQSALFEHIAAVAPIFGLVIYNEESGWDSDTIDIRSYVNVPPAPAQPATTTKA